MRQFQDRIRKAFALLLAASAACSGGSKDSTGPVTPPAPVPTSIVAASTITQAGVAGGVATDKPSVKVTTAAGVPVSGVVINFAVTAGGGGVEGGAQTTGADGIASLAKWTLGTVVGSNTLTATSPSITGASAVFTVTTVASAAAHVTLKAGDAQTLAVASSVPAKPSVRITDAFDNPVGGVVVNFAVTSGGGTVEGSSQTSDADGIATVGNWTAGTAVGQNTLTASAPSVAGVSVVFSATTVPGPAFSIVLRDGDAQTAAAGSSVPIKPSVRVTDAYSNPVAGVHVLFAVSTGGGLVTGSDQVTAADGVATAGSWILGTTFGENTLTATSPAVAAKSVKFSAVAIPASNTLLLSAGYLTSGREVVVQSATVAGLSITIGGAAATVRQISSTEARFTPPDPLFQPCVKAGAKTSAVFRRPGLTDTTVSFGLSITGKPIRLAVGEHRFLSAAELDCAIELTGAGTYMAMVYAWDQPRDDGFIGWERNIPAPLEVVVGGNPAGAAPPALSAFQSNSRVSPSIDLEPMRLPLPARSILAAVCPTPVTIGSQIEVMTGRGTYNGKPALVPSFYPSIPELSWQIEPWRLRYITNDLAVFVDSTTWRRFEENKSLTDARWAKFVAVYDSTLGKTRQAFLPGTFNARQGEGRSVIYWSAIGTYQNWTPSANALAFREDCREAQYRGTGLNVPDGASMTLPSLDFDNPARWTTDLEFWSTIASLMAHETAHVYDHSTVNDRYRLDWTNEAYAVFFEWLTMSGGSTALLDGNYTRGVAGDHGTCGDPSRSSLRGFYTRPLFHYPTTCQWESWLAQRAADQGIPLSSVFSKLREPIQRQTMAHMYNAVLGTNRPSSEVAGEWLLSWYADDFVPGTARALQDRAFKLRSVPGYEWPSVVWADQSASVKTMIGEPDVFMVEVRASGSTAIDIRLSNGLSLPSDRLGVALIRAK
jgi:hypothetical protein